MDSSEYLFRGICEVSGSGRKLHSLFDGASAAHHREERIYTAVIAEFRTIADGAAEGDHRFIVFLSYF